MSPFFIKASGRFLLLRVFFKRTPGFVDTKKMKLLAGNPRRLFFLCQISEESNLIILLKPMMRMPRRQTNQPP